jgi:dihydroneopterin aldolase
MMDTIVIRGLRYNMLIGIHPKEKHKSQTVSIDLDIGLPEGATSHDELQYTIDYEQVALRIGKLAGSQHFGLVETFAARVAGLVIRDLGAAWVKVTAGKVGILPNAEFVGISVKRERETQQPADVLASRQASPKLLKEEANSG